MTKATIHNIKTLPYTVNNYLATYGVLSKAFPTEASAIVSAKSKSLIPNSHTEVIHEPTGKVVLEIST